MSGMLDIVAALVLADGRFYNASFSQMELHAQRQLLLLHVLAVLGDDEQFAVPFKELPFFIIEQIAPVAEQEPLQVLG